MFYFLVEVSNLNFTRKSMRLVPGDAVVKNLPAMQEDPVES